MTKKQTAHYGAWQSPITADLIVAGVVKFGDLELDGDETYWTEGRPNEGGRSTLARRTAAGAIADITPAPFNVRTRVHEYGGAASIASEGTAYFSNFADNRLYRLQPDSEAQPITPPAALRYADLLVDTHHKQLICVREDHSTQGHEPVNTLVRLPLDGDSQGGQVLVSGNDFYSSPCLSPGGTRLAWLTWNHPNMPWDGTELWVGELDTDGALQHPQRVAGGAEESLFQPQWSPDGILHFISDRTGWWNLYRLRDGQIEALCQKEAEFGSPQWAFGMSTYGFAGPNRILCRYIQQGISSLASLDTTTGDLTPIETPYTVITKLLVDAQRAVFFAASPTEALSIVQLDLQTLHMDVLRRASTITLDPASISLPQTIEFPTEHGLTAYAFYYPPTNPAFDAPQGALPPLLVKSHGGPTSAFNTMLDLETQFWTSRGFAVLEVNYGGSTGYGSAYRKRLNGQWGIVDMDDCVNGASYLVERGLVDGNRLAIAGGSAGGYTTLCALAFRKVFKAGASYFGLSALEEDLLQTHKFESHYSFSMIAPYPERRDIYCERSPIYYADQISCPVIFFQGLDDKVVIPNQSEMMVEAMRARKIPVAYLAFEGEGHGFRLAENIKRSLEAELYFYSRVFGFQPADQIEPVLIENM